MSHSELTKAISNLTNVQRTIDDLSDTVTNLAREIANHSLTDMNEDELNYVEDKIFDIAEVLRKLKTFSA